MPKPIRRQRKKDSQGNEIERRSARRLSPDSVPTVRGARLLAGPEIELINLSKGGALLESDTRITPGANISIRLVATDEVVLLRGVVLRSRVSQLRGTKLTYEWAVAFDEECSLFAGMDEISHAAEDANLALSLEEDAAVTEEWIVAGREDATEPLTVTIKLPDSRCGLSQLTKRLGSPAACRSLDGA